MERTTDWEHYDAAAITVAASFVKLSMSPDELREMIKRAYDVADEIASEAHRRRKHGVPVMLYDTPVGWVRGICQSQDHPKRNDASMVFLMNMLREGHPLGPSLQEAVGQVEALSPEDVDRFAPNAGDISIGKPVQKHAVELLKRQFS